MIDAPRLCNLPLLVLSCLGYFLGAASLAAAETSPALRSVIDREVQAVWQREKVTPAARADDGEFLRRVYLDLVGDVPTYEETIAFLDDPATDKRAKLIDRLLDDPRYAQHLTDVWDLLLFGRNPSGYDTDKRDGLQKWLREQFARNAPYDELARTLLKGSGNSVDDGPPLFYMQYKNQPEDATEAITQIFLGVQLQCARCHDHPFENWKQVDFYGMAAFVSRLEVVSVGKEKQLTKYMIGEKSTGDILFTGPAKDQAPGKKGEPIKPRFLLGAKVDEPPLPEKFQEVKFTANQVPTPPQYSRKDQLADWITQPTNPFFARALANRVWGQFLGRGLVHPVDNLSPSNAPSHPALLDALAQSLVATRFDLKAFIRELVNSETYQLSSAGGDGSQFPEHYAAARVRPLSAEELIESWRTVTGYESLELAGKIKPGSTSRYRPLDGYLLRFFGSPNSGAGDFQGGLHEHLYLNNGPVGTVIATGEGSLHDALLADEPIEQRVDQLYLTLLNRRPSTAERERLSAYLSSLAKNDTRVREAIWALMTSSEFRFNH